MIIKSISFSMLHNNLYRYTNIYAIYFVEFFSYPQSLNISFLID